MDARIDWSLDNTTGTVEEVWLLGQPPLPRYLDFVKKKAVCTANRPRAELVDEWREANDYFYSLETKEAGLADQIRIRDLDQNLQPLIDDVRQDTRFRRAFDTLPTRFALVELDRLVVSQSHVDLTHARRLQTRLVAGATPEDIFRFCLPIDGGEAPVQVRSLGSRRFLFWSRSSDFRFHEAALLEPDQISEHSPYGSLGRVLGLMVGYGSNFLNAIQSENRLVLHNGHHRAYALREMGITHAPCIIRTVTRRDELNLVASSDTAEDPTFFFKAARPPLLKDFFDPKVRKILRVPKLLRAVEISFETKEYELKDFELAD
jgi:hypothetical protein